MSRRAALLEHVGREIAPAGARATARRGGREPVGLARAPVWALRRAVGWSRGAAGRDPADRASAVGVPTAGRGHARRTRARRSCSPRRTAAASFRCCFKRRENLGLSEDALDPAEQEGLVVIGAERLSFRHPLVRSAVYESATFNDRRRAHAALAAACSAELQIDRRVWHQAIATLTPDERHRRRARGVRRAVSRTRRTCVGRHRLRTGGEVEPNRAGTRTASGRRRRVGLHRRTDRAGAQPGRSIAAHRRPA